MSNSLPNNCGVALAEQAAHVIELRSEHSNKNKMLSCEYSTKIEGIDGLFQ
jgi:hypothetical protein